MTDQYPFDLAPSPDFSFENFYVGQSNSDAFAAIKAFPDWPSPICLLIGPEGSGKTHLGQAWKATNTGVQVIDNADRLSEMNLFRAINEALNGDVPGLLLISDRLPGDWNVELPDLQSRLRNVTLLTIFEPGEDILEPIIRKLFEDRGRTVKGDLVSYIYTHFERSVPAVSQLVHDIDTAASATKRDVTRNFVSSFLKRAGGR